MSPYFGSAFSSYPRPSDHQSLAGMTQAETDIPQEELCVDAGMASSIMDIMILNYVNRL
jgi:hypothetical protein